MDDLEDLDARYYVALGAAFVRGRVPELTPAAQSADDGGPHDTAVFRAGLAYGLKLHKFKRNADLPRVRRVLSMLTALYPESLLDVGSGRGAFLWPLLDTFPQLAVTAIDKDERRASDLAALSRGGITRLDALQMDATTLTFEDDTFDGATLLEVLEHMPDPARAAREAVRVARRFVVATVPSKEDDNPEHIHLFDRQSFGRLFEEAGARRVSVEHVLNHIVVLAQIV